MVFYLVESYVKLNKQIYGYHQGIVVQTVLPYMYLYNHILGNTRILMRKAWTHHLFAMTNKIYIYIDVRQPVRSSEATNDVI